MHIGRKVRDAGQFHASQGRSYEGLEKLGDTVSVPRDREIHLQGAPADYCFRVVDGCVRKVEFLQDGRRHVNCFRLPGEFFGLHDRRTHTFTAEAVTDVTLRRYRRAEVDRLAASEPALAQWLAAMCLHDLHAAYRRMSLLNRKTSAEKVAAFILEMDSRLTATGRMMLDMPMGRADIADYLGLTTETVCRALTQFQREGFVQVRRNEIELHDHPSLSALVAEPGFERRGRAAVCA